MLVVVSEVISASKEKVWSIVTDIENAKKNISSIKKIEVLEKPTSGLVGIKWKETRIMFGKEATETMWITQAKENQFYEVMAISSGCIYTTMIQLEEVPQGIKLTMNFNASPQTLLAKAFIPLSFLFKGMLVKALQQDLLELKNAAERGS